MNKKNILLPIVAFIFFFIPFQAYGVKAYPFPITVTQPDGSTLTIQLQGDEFHHYKTSDDGVLLKENTKGFLTYATVNAAGDVVESQYIAHNASKRSILEMQFLKTVNQATILQKTKSAPSRVKMLSTQTIPQKSFPLAGSPKSLVILVNFTDTAFVVPTPQVAYTNLLNQVGYNTNGGTGSARDYFMASSYGKFTPNFDVVGPVNLPHTMAYYGANNSSGNDTNAVQMIVDACTAASAAGLDFTQYDTDNDGVVDNVFVYYAGYNEAEGGPVNSVWPHRWGVYPQVLYGSGGSNYTGTLASITFNGKRILDYACTSELRGKTGTNMCGVGTFCHEFGHVLGLPDYYDTSGAGKATLSNWSIMDNGNYLNSGRTPPVYSSYDRFFLGWLTPEQESSTAALSLNPIYQGTTPPANTTNQAFLLSETTHNLVGNNPTPNEFFILEYRKKTGWDTYLPAEGMCIWHIDYNQTAWDNNNPNYYSGSTQTAASHMRVYLVPPPGVGTTPPTTAFTTGSYTPLSWAGTDINRQLTNITKTPGNVTFNFMPSRMLTTGSFTGFSTIFGTPTAAQSINFSAYNLTGNLNLTLQNGIHYEMKLSTDASWAKSLSLAPVAGNVIGIVQVRYNPTMTGTQTDQFSIAGPGITTSTYTLTGTNAIGPTSPVIFVGKIDNAVQFQPTKLNISNTKKINLQASDIVSDINLAMSGTDAAMFTVLPGTILKASATALGGYTLTVTYIPTTLGNHTATLTISGGGLNPVKVITLTGSGI